MTRIITPLPLIVLLACGATPGRGEQPEHVGATKATMIAFDAAEGAAPELRELLDSAGPIVSETEPDTLLWYGLEAEAGRFGIFDVFTDAAGRQAHFDGRVAAALQDRAAALVDGGWQDGVVDNVRNFDVLVATPVRAPSPSLATYIEFRAREGRGEALAELLSGAGDVVWQTEPGTLFWTALRDESDRRRFVIYDTFETADGRDAHFAGQVAAALQSAAGELIEGGWDGVVAGVRHFEVRSTN